MSHAHATRVLVGAAWMLLAACNGSGAARDEAGKGTAADDKTANTPGGGTATTSESRPAASAPVVHRLASGTHIILHTDTVLTSRHNHAGDPITATTAADVRDASGTVVIPRGAVFVGTITRIAPAEHPGGQGTLELAFTEVRYNGHTRPISDRVDSMATIMAGRGITSGEVIKTGAGTAVGAVAGRIIGGNTTGAVVGAAAGTAAGAGYAAATRDVDIVLPKGATVRVVLTTPLVM